MSYTAGHTIAYSVLTTVSRLGFSMKFMVFQITWLGGNGGLVVNVILPMNIKCALLRTRLFALCTH